MSTTRATLRGLLEKRFREESPILGGTVGTMGSTTTLTDTSRAEDSDYFINWHVYLESASAIAPSGEERRVKDFMSASTIEVHPAFSSSAGENYIYELRQKARRLDYNDAINEAIRNARGCWFDYQRDTTTVIICSDQLRYDLPTDVQEILRIDLEQCDVKDTGTATGGGATTLEDTDKTWDTNEWQIGYAVVIYDGSGEGEQKNISNNTPTVLNIIGTWDTNPDTTSKYKIKYIGTEEHTWLPIRHYYHDKDTTHQIHFYRQYSEGMSVRLYYVAEPAELTADSGTGGTTDIPPEYIVLEGMSYLWDLIGNEASGRDEEWAVGQSERYHMRAEEYKGRHGYKVDWARIQEAPEFGRRISGLNPLDW